MMIKPSDSLDDVQVVQWYFLDIAAFIANEASFLTVDTIPSDRIDRILWYVNSLFGLDDIPTLVHDARLYYRLISGED